MTDLEHLARAATHELLDRTVPDVAGRYAELKRIRTRRTAAKLVAVAAAVAMAVGGWQISGGTDRQDIRPAEPVDLGLRDARPFEPVVLASARTTDRGDELDYDRFDGVTDDGLVVRQRYRYDGDVSELGLIDPATGDTEWLPRPPWDLGEPRPLDLSADRLLYLDNRNANRWGILLFDRATKSWSRQQFGRPDEPVDRFFGFQALLGDDGRIYLLDPPVDALRWFSIAPGEPSLRPEPALDGLLLAFSDRGRITTDANGRVVFTPTGGEPAVVEDGFPEGCEPEKDFLPSVALAGDRPVVNLPCRSGHLVKVFDATGRLFATVRGTLGIGAIGPDHVVLTTDENTYTLDLRQPALYLIDGAPDHNSQSQLDQVHGDLAVWTVLGPLDDDNSTHDAVAKAALLP